MNNYKIIIDKYKPKVLKGITPDIILQILVELCQNISKLTPEIKTYLIDILTENYPLEEKKENLKYFLIMYIKYFDDKDITKNTPIIQTPSKIYKLEEGCETNPSDVINLKPEDFKDMEYDEEFLKKLGWKPDGRR